VHDYGPGLAPSSALLDEGEVWYYFDRNLRLQFQPRGFEMYLVPYVAFGGELRHLADHAEQLYHLDTARTTYAPPGGLRMVDVVMECYPFRRADGSYDVYLACATPLSSMAHSTGWRSNRVAYVARVMAFDSTLQKAWTDSVRVRQQFGRVPRGQLAQNQWATRLPAGFYVFAVELEDSASNKRAVTTYDRWLVPVADTVELDLSPLVLAADIRQATEGACAFVRNGHEVIAMPGHVFAKDQDVCFYHEVYNLQQDSSGHCTYTIEYALYDHKGKSRRGLMLKRLESRERHTYQAGRIPHTNIGKGRYILEVKTTDLNSGTVKTALTRLRVS
jgi:hypothetical protein